jgi:hypothetical protein
MSRIRVFGLDGRSQGEFTGILPRGWAIVGTPDVRGGGQTTLEIPQETAAKNFLDLGRVVLVEDGDLPPWAGVIDPGWQAYAKPSLTLFNIEYLLSLHDLDDVTTIRGSTAYLLKKILQLVNEQEDTGIRAGSMDKDPEHEETLERRSAWEQIKEIVTNAGMELTFRPLVVSGRLVIYMDLDQRSGKQTGFLYHDGTNANMAVQSASIDNEVVNRVIGVNDASSEDERLVTRAVADKASIREFRMRSRVIQFDGVTDMKALEARALQYLNDHKRPHLALPVNILDQGLAFRNARLGNGAIFHAADVRLPGGIHGFRGPGTIQWMSFDEATRQLQAGVVAEL